MLLSGTSINGQDLLSLVDSFNPFGIDLLLLEEASRVRWPTLAVVIHFLSSTTFVSRLFLCNFLLFTKSFWGSSLMLLFYVVKQNKPFFRHGNESSFLFVHRDIEIHFFELVPMLIKMLMLIYMACSLFSLVT